MSRDACLGEEAKALGANVRSKEAPSEATKVSCGLRSDKSMGRVTDAIPSGYAVTNETLSSGWRVTYQGEHFVQRCVALGSTSA
jgi:hypothetical protein